MPTDTTVEVKLLPENAEGTFPLTSASYITLTTRSRYARPYPPGNLCYSGKAYGTRYTFALGNQLFTWSSRNRLTQTAAGILTKQDAGDVAGESGQTFKVLVVIGGSTVRTVSAIAVETFTYAVADRLTDGGTGAVTLKFFANANSLDSFQSPSVTFELTGFGLDFGRGFGGLQA